MGNKEKVFGQKEPGADYISRFGAYVVIPNEHQQVILVQAPNGAFFLPGGEIEPGESVSYIHVTLPTNREVEFFCTHTLFSTKNIYNMKDTSTYDNQ